MRLHSFKKFIIIYVTVIGLIGIVSTFYLDIFTCNSTKSELRELYKAEFHECKINGILDKLYPSGGHYKLFSVDCMPNYFPILLENMTFENEQYFRNSIIISKQKSDYQLTLRDGEKTYLLSARKPENENGLGSIVRIILIFLIVLVSSVQFFIPDHYYDKFSKIERFKKHKLTRSV